MSPTSRATSRTRGPYAPALLRGYGAGDVRDALFGILEKVPSLFEGRTNQNSKTEQRPSGTHGVCPCVCVAVCESGPRGRCSSRPLSVRVPFGANEGLGMNAISRIGRCARQVLRGASFQVPHCMSASGDTSIPPGFQTAWHPPTAPRPRSPRHHGTGTRSLGWSLCKTGWTKSARWRRACV